MGVLYANVAGVWTPVSSPGGGSDEVFIGPDDPISTVPTTELWFDTDDSSGISLASAEIFHTEITSNVTVNALSAAAANAVINPGNVTYDGTPIMLEFFASSFQLPTTANQQMLINLWDGNTDLGYIAQLMNGGGNTVIGTTVHRRLTPTPGVHNYNIRAWISPAGTGTIQAGLGNGIATFAPAFLRATKAIAAGAYIAAPAAGLEANKPAAAAFLTGLRYFATDTLRDWLCDGIGWIIMAEPPQTWVPAIANTSGGTKTGAYQRSNGLINIQGSFVLGAISGDLVVTLPIAGASTMSAASFRAHGTGAGTEASLLPCSASGTTLYVRAVNAAGTYIGQAIVSATVPWTWAATNALYISGHYPMASRYS